jgi:ABC-2 type transport system ATP-binding protein
VSVRSLGHAYGERTALDQVSFTVQPGEFFGLLGPNGSGKTTLFRILATLAAPATGEARIFGHDVSREPDAVRARLGIVFQSPALDGQLTVMENLRHHARLQGLPRAGRTQRIDELLSSLGLQERRRERVATLSGGLKRRVDLARGLLHRPGLLLLDEPTNGLDPTARRDLWRHLERLRQESGLTLVVTTHLMDEGERCDRLAILDGGRLVALDTPSALRAEVGGTVITLRGGLEPAALARRLSERLGLAAQVMDGGVRLEHPDGHALVPRLAAAVPEGLAAITVQAPTLEDVFVHRTGHRFEESAGGAGP